MRNDYYTYAYLREDGTPYYIGKGKGKRAFVKHGRGRIAVPAENRILFLKKNLTEKEAFRHECYMIAVLGRKDLGTGILRNLTDGGEGASNPSEKTREKRGKAIKGIKRSEETRRKMSVAAKGKKRSEETRRKISEAKKGSKHTTEWKEKMRLIMTGPNSPNYGRKASEEERKKMSAIRSKDYKITFKDGKEILVNGLKRWAEENGYYYDSVCRVSSGIRKSYKDIISVEKLGR